MTPIASELLTEAQRRVNGSHGCIWANTFTQMKLCLRTVSLAQPWSVA